MRCCCTTVIGIIYRSSSIKWYRMLSAPGAAVREDLILLRNCMSLHISTWNHLVPALEQIPRIVSPIVATSEGCDLSSCLLACSMQQAKIKQAGEGLTEGRHASQKHDRSYVCFLLCFPSFSFLPSFYSFLPSFYPGSFLPSFLPVFQMFNLLRLTENDKTHVRTNAMCRKLHHKILRSIDH